jgi:predicted nuclease of restriction endonuclease-like (RecB) superfamily
LLHDYPGAQNLLLLERLDEPATRIWYAKQAIAHGWSRSILAINFERHLHKRAGRAVNYFKATLPPPDSDLAAQAFKDPYLFDFLGTADPRRERDVEDSLVAHIERFLLELASHSSAARSRSRSATRTSGSTGSSIT